MPTIAQNIAQLERERDEVWQRSNVLVERLRNENRDFHDDERREFDALAAELNQRSQRINDLRRTAGVDSAVQDFRTRYEGRRGRDGTTQTRILPTRGEYFDMEAEQRRLGSQSAGVILPVEQSNEWFDRLRSRSVFLNAGPRTIEVTGHSLRLPVVTASVTVGARDDGTAIPPTDPTLDARVLEPVSFAGIGEVTNEVLADTGGQALDILAQDLVSQTTTELDKAFFNSTGAASPAHRIYGLLNVTGTQTIAAGGALTIDHLLAALTKLEAENADRTRIAFFFNPAGWAAIRGQKDGQQRYVLAPDVGSAEAPTLFGAPAYVSANVPASSVLAVDLDQVVVGIGEHAHLAYSDQAKFYENVTAVRLTTRVDLAVINPKGIAKITGITA